MVPKNEDDKNYIIYPFSSGRYIYSKQILETTFAQTDIVDNVPAGES